MCPAPIPIFINPMTQERGGQAMELGPTWNPT